MKILKSIETILKNPLFVYINHRKNWKNPENDPENENPEKYENDPEKNPDTWTGVVDRPAPGSRR